MTIVVSLRDELKRVLEKIALIYFESSRRNTIIVNCQLSIVNSHEMFIYLED